MDFIASVRPASPRMPGMTIGGRAAYVEPWVNGHCKPLVAGYRCEWRGLELEYQ